MGTKALILAVETSSRVGSVALAKGERLLEETVFSGPMKHSVELFPAIEQLLERFGYKGHQIQHVYISIGPGSFTGLRIGVALAKMMAFAAGSQIVGVDTLDVLAANVAGLVNTQKQQAGQSKREQHRQGETDQLERIEQFATILDAKRGQFYVAVYRRAADGSKPDRFEPVAGYEKVQGDALMTAEELIDRFAHPDCPLWLLGDGLVYHRNKFACDSTRFLAESLWSPRASEVHRLGWQLAQMGRFVDPVQLSPAYLRKPEPEEKRAKQSSENDR